MNCPLKSRRMNEDLHIPSPIVTKSRRLKRSQRERDSADSISLQLQCVCCNYRETHYNTSMSTLSQVTQLLPRSSTNAHTLWNLTHSCSGYKGQLSVWRSDVQFSAVIFIHIPAVRVQHFEVEVCVCVVYELNGVFSHPFLQEIANEISIVSPRQQWD